MHLSPAPLPVVLVDDDDHDYFLICRALQGAGVTAPIVRFSSASTAIEYLEGEQQFGRVPRLVFLSTAIRSGIFGVLGWMRNHPAFDATKAVVMSRTASHADRDRAAALGADYCEVRVSSSALEHVLAGAVQHAASSATVEP